MTATITTAMDKSTCEYALGYSNAEHDRLIRQALLIAPITERFLREAGIGTGHRVLDLGSGLGDVSMVVAGLVGPSGEVVGLERDASSIAKASARVEAARFRNVVFAQGDVNDIVSEKTFDAAVGRFILMFQTDPLSVLKSVSRLVRPSGILAFQEPSWTGMLAMAARLPLWSRVLGTIHETFLRSGINPEMGLDLPGKFQTIGLPAPTMHLDMLLGSDATFPGIMLGLLRSLLPLAEKHGLPLAELGYINTLSERIQAEILAANAVVGFVPIVSAWARKPF